LAEGHYVEQLEETYTRGRFPFVPLLLNKKNFPGRDEASRINE